MAGFLWFTEKISKWMNVIAYTALTFIMLLTVTDVILRLDWIRKPIVGTFEIVQLAGAIVFAFGMPITSWVRGMIYVDFLINKFPNGIKNTINILTRVTSILIFIFIAYNLFGFATDLLRSGEVTPTRQIPFYPIIYGMSFACLVLVLVLITDIVKIMGGKYE
jgi:TRAP-type C4-dicarboxylate transport system permease small subunit